MRCFLPFVEELSPAGERVLRIAQVLGADCLPVRLPRGSANPVGDLENAIPEIGACIAICPAVIRAWLGSDQFPSSLASCLVTRFQFLLVHELDTNPISANVLRALSQEALTYVRHVENPSTGYQVTSEELCGAFSGLVFGPANPADRVLGAKSGQKSIDPIISIGGEPLFARLRLGATEIFFTAGAATVGPDSDVAERKVAEYFSELLPVAMFLRYAFKNECWHPQSVPHATLIVDDPPLWKKYGFLNYERLLSLMDEFNFHTTIAFIPYYWQESSPETIRLFRARPDRFSICFHGNNHTRSEFAIQDSRRLNGLLRTAQARMQWHEDLTEIPCDKVMVFPQCRFSRNALRALKEHNFIAHVNSGHSPQEQTHIEHIPLNMLALMQPSVLACNAFPFFPRKRVRDFRPEDVAFNAFFGRPILIEAHHEVFTDPSPLLELVSFINRTVPQVHWGNLQRCLENACWVRRTEDGTLRVRPYAMTGQITNPGCSPLRCVAEWPSSVKFAGSGASVLVDGIPSSDIEEDDADIRISFEVAPRATRTIVLHHTIGSDSLAHANSLFRQRPTIHLRRRLSELRDNVLSKNAAVLSCVQSLRHALFS
jgi:hypothetical protein